MKNKIILEQIITDKLWNNIKNDTLRAYAAAGCFGTQYRMGQNPLNNQIEGVYVVETKIGPSTSQPQYETVRFFYSPEKTTEVRGIKFTANTGTDFSDLTPNNKVKEVIYNCSEVGNLIVPPVMQGSEADRVLNFFYTSLKFLPGNEQNVNKNMYRQIPFKDIQNNTEFKQEYGNYYDRYKSSIDAIQNLPFADNTYFWMPTKKLGARTDYNSEINQMQDKYRQKDFYECTPTQAKSGENFYIDLSDYYSGLFQRGSYWCKEWEKIKATPDLCKSTVSDYQKSAQFDETPSPLSINVNKSYVAKCIKSPELNSNLKGPNPYYKPFDKKLNQLPKNYGGIIQYINNIPPSSVYSLRPRLAESEYKLGKLISESLQRLKIKKYNRY